MSMNFRRGKGYDKRKAIKRDGKIIGWHLYKTDGIFNTLRFVGYLWRN